MTNSDVARPIRARRLLVVLAFGSLIVPVALAQSQALSVPDTLLDKMTGHWVMTGTIGKKAATHEVDVDWVLKREYIRIHEVSREKDAGGGIGYEAWIYIVWDAKKSEYAVMWLDNTAATNFAPEGIGHAKPDGDRIPFIFKDAEGHRHSNHLRVRTREGYVVVDDRQPGQVGELVIVRKVDANAQQVVCFTAF